MPFFSIKNVDMSLSAFASPAEVNLPSRHSPSVQVLMPLSLPQSTVDLIHIYYF